MIQNFTYPIVLNASINATLAQPPQSWWASNLISTLVGALVTIAAVYLGQKLAGSAEKEREFRRSRRHAYYDFISQFSGFSERDKAWSNEILFKLWQAALVAGEYGDIYSDTIIHTNISTIIKDFDILMTTNHEFKSGYKKSIIKRDDGLIEIKNLNNFIKLLEILQHIDSREINKEKIFDIGRSFYKRISDILLEEKEPKVLFRFYRNI